MTQANTTEKLSAAARPLVERAFERYGSSCLWNMPFPTDATGAAAVAKALKDNGGMGAWQLAARLEEALGYAS